MDKKFRKSITFLISIFIVVAFSIFATSSVFAATCSDYQGTNKNYNDYADLRWSSPVESYLYECQDGRFMKVQYLHNEKQTIAEYFDKDYAILKRVEIPTELNLFGGFYSDDKYFYILTGQVNPGADLDEKRESEVYRITKYDMNWKKISDCKIYGALTNIPFEAGSARMTHTGRYLLIHTSHVMFNGHQSNVTFEVDTETMELTSKRCEVDPNTWGYVSHSFNQFIKIRNGKVVTLDHGDAYPRSLCLIEYDTDCTSGNFTTTKARVTDIVNFVGDAGVNYTGASVGGFEISNTHYITAYNKAPDLGESRKDLFLGLVDLETKEVRNVRVNDDDVDYSCKTPQLVKINNDKFMILWVRNGQVNFRLIDGQGNFISEIKTISASLSDCQPIVVGDKVIWYMWQNSTTTFYELDINTLELTSHKNDYSHVDVYGKANAGIVKATCQNCGRVKTYTIPQALNNVEVNYKPSYPYGTFDRNENIHFYCYFKEYPVGLLNDIVVTSDNEEVATVDRVYMTTADVTTHKPGVANIKIRLKYDPTVTYTYSLRVGKKGEIPISDCQVVLDKNTIAYNGYNTTYPKAKVYYKGRLLEIATDYSLDFENWYSVGTATVRVFGHGIFGGNTGKNYKIVEDKPSVPTNPPTSEVTLAAPKVQVSNGISQVSVKWNKVSRATGYKVYRKVSGGNWTLLKTTTSTTILSYSDKTAKNGKTYYYRVRAVRGSTVSKYSASKKIVRLTRPSITSASNLATRKIKIRWSKNSAATGYQVKYVKGTTVKTKTVKGSSILSTTISSLTKGKTYSVSVRTYKTVNGVKYYSSWTSAKKVTVRK